MKDVTITQQNNLFYLWIGKYIYKIFSCAERAKKAKEEIKKILDN